jgi:hypothetical protein
LLSKRTEILDQTERRTETMKNHELDMISVCYFAEHGKILNFTAYSFYSILLDAGSRPIKFTASVGTNSLCYVVKKQTTFTD